MLTRCRALNNILKFLFTFRVSAIFLNKTFYCCITTCCSCIAGKYRMKLNLRSLRRSQQVTECISKVRRLLSLQICIIATNFLKIFFRRSAELLKNYKAHNSHQVNIIIIICQGGKKQTGVESIDCT